MKEISLGLWIFLSSIVVACALGFYTLVPRYEYTLIENGKAMLIYDRWAGRFQVATYDGEWTPTLRRVLLPF